jgi:YNFM family putative membrane transporter
MSSEGASLERAPTVSISGPSLVRGTRAYRFASLALFLAGFATFSQLYCVQPLLPIFSQYFGVSPTVSSLALSLSTGFLAVSIFVAAPISEAFGRRGLMFASMMAASVLNLLAATTPSWSIMLLLRGLEGVALGGVPAVAMAYLAEEMEPTGLGLAMGLYVAGNAFGGMAGRVVTGALAEVLSWRAALGGVGATGLIAAIGFRLWLPVSRNFTPRRQFDVGFHLRAWSTHLRDPGLALLFAIAFLSMGSFVAVYNFLSFRLTVAPYRLSQGQLGLIFSVYIFGIGASAVAGLITQRFDRRLVLPAAVVLTALGVVVTLSSSLPMIVLGVVLLTSAFFVVHPVASAWVGQLARVSKGHASSLYLLAYYIGSSAMGSAAGWFYALAGWPALVCFILVLLTAALLAALALRRLVVAPI